MPTLYKLMVYASGEGLYLFSTFAILQPILYYSGLFK